MTRKLVSSCGREKIIISWIAGAVILAITRVIFSLVSVGTAPYNIFSIGSMG
jgi:hypothetical protein